MIFKIISLIVLVFCYTCSIKWGTNKSDTYNKSFSFMVIVWFLGYLSGYGI